MEMSNTVEQSNTQEKKVKKVKKTTQEPQTQTQTQEPKTQEPKTQEPKTQEPQTQTKHTETSAINEYDVGFYLEDFDLQCDKLLDFSKNLKDMKIGNKENRIKFDQVMKKFMKTSILVQSSFFDSCMKQISSMEKSASVKVVPEKKKIMDKGKAAVNIEQPVRDILLTFMELPKGTLVSRSQALNSINSFIKEEKEKKNPEIFVENDKRAFKAVGKLKILLNGINEVMVSKGVTDAKIPDHIYYTSIMGLMSHCFYKPGEVTSQ
jgi:hypothetical protein